jgi:hypothetical protein
MSTFDEAMAGTTHRADSKSKSQQPAPKQSGANSGKPHVPGTVKGKTPDAGPSQEDLPKDRKDQIEHDAQCERAKKGEKNIAAKVTLPSVLGNRTRVGLAYDAKHEVLLCMKGKLVGTRDGQEYISPYPVEIVSAEPGSAVGVTETPVGDFGVFQYKKVILNPQ